MFAGFPFSKDWCPFMVLLSVHYPKTSDSHFNHDYYLRKHMPLVRTRWQSMGLASDTLLRGTSTLDGGPPVFELIAVLTFGSMDEVKAALAAHGGEIIGDVANFTNIAPLIQVNSSVL
jgi:uncharacterized protein (TIGR02118 family)